MVMCKVSIIVLICQKFGSLGPVQQKIKFPSPKRFFLLAREFRRFIMKLRKRENLKCKAKTCIIDDIFLLKTGIPVFRVHPQIFSGVFLFWLRSEKVVVKHMLLKNIHVHSSRVLNFVYIFLGLMLKQH